MCSIWVFYRYNQPKTALWLLLLSALAIRLWMAALDPFLQNWDERFHALVAKNMMELPFHPMLFADPVLPFKIEDWWQNHTWVHKQPLFLWMMAFAMKLFGATPFVFRLPSVILGTWMVKCIYDIGHRWTRNNETAFLSALLATFSWYALEMISGWISLDHNDFTFTCFITGAIWAFTKWLNSPAKWKWAMLIGFLVGCAVLIKWLTAFLVFGGWGLYILLTPALRKNIYSWLQVFFAFEIALLVFMPWQFYISSAFPEETAIAYGYNVKHIFKNLGHEGPWYFHLQFFPSAYQWICIPLLSWGLISIFRSKTIDRAMSISFLAMVVVLYGFFAIVQTKMPAFVYPAQCILWIVIAYGAWDLISRIHVSKKMLGYISFSSIALLCILCLKPSQIVAHRAKRNIQREIKLSNTKQYNELSSDIANNYVILNTPLHENIELMFYKGGTSYSIIPSQTQLDSLEKRGIRFAYFTARDSTNTIPEYIRSNPKFLPVQAGLRQ